MGFTNPLLRGLGNVISILGCVYSMAALGMSLVALNDISVSANVMFPLTQETLYDEGDAIEFGNLFSVTTSYLF